MKPGITHLSLPREVRVLVRVRAAQTGTTVSKYVEALVLADAAREGLDRKGIPSKVPGGDHP
jgi:hypothetical protein